MTIQLGKLSYELIANIDNMFWEAIHFTLYWFGINDASRHPVALVPVYRSNIVESVKTTSI